VVRLIPVVVLGSNPEEGKNGAVEKGLQGLGQANSRQRLVEAVEGAGEQAGLLTGGDEKAAFRQEPVQALSGGMGGCLDHPGCPATAGFVEAFVDFRSLSPVCGGVPEIPCEEWRHRRPVPKVVGHQGRAFGKAREDLEFQSVLPVSGLAG
jgi:hypothetical protein